MSYRPLFLSYEIPLSRSETLTYSRPPAHGPSPSGSPESDAASLEMDGVTRIWLKGHHPFGEAGHKASRTTKIRSFRIHLTPYGAAAQMLFPYA